MNIDKEKLLALRNKNFPLRTVPQALSALRLVVPVDEFLKVFPHAVKIQNEHFLPPTLEELFMVLGSYFIQLKREGTYFLAKGGKTQLTQTEVDGDTPLEALVNLFLSLHE